MRCCASRSRHEYDSARELQVVGQAAAPPEEWLRAARRARLLSWISLAWMGTEGLVGIAAGLIAGSIALTGFGINAFIEGFASVVIVWRFTGSRMHSPDRRATRASDRRRAVLPFRAISDSVRSAGQSRVPLTPDVHSSAGARPLTSGEGPIVASEHRIARTRRASGPTPDSPQDQRTST